MYRPRPLDDRLAAVVPPESLYAVGGRVRDEIRATDGQTRAIGLDSDYVVVGIPVTALVDRLRALGRVDVVGASFSVLKLTVDGRDRGRRDCRGASAPSGSDIAISRFESGPDVTLEEDLGRRDFRMNMIARAIPTGRIVDPYGGEADIRARRIDILTRPKPLKKIRCACCAPPSSRRASSTRRPPVARWRWPPPPPSSRPSRRSASTTSSSSSLPQPTALDRAPAPRGDRRAAHVFGPSSWRASGSSRTSGTPTTSGIIISPPSMLRRQAI